MRGSDPCLVRGLKGSCCFAPRRGRACPRGGVPDIGLDLGQAQETTALAVLEQGKGTPRRYALRHLRRWPPGIGYVAMAEEVEQVCQSLPAMPFAAVDITAVG